MTLVPAIVQCPCWVFDGLLSKHQGPASPECISPIPMCGNLHSTSFYVMLQYQSQYWVVFQSVLGGGSGRKRQSSLKKHLGGLPLKTETDCRENKKPVFPGNPFMPSHSVRTLRLTPSGPGSQPQLPGGLAHKLF